MRRLLLLGTLLTLPGLSAEGADESRVPTRWREGCALEVPPAPPNFGWRVCPIQPEGVASCEWLAPERGRVAVGSVHFAQGGEGDVHLGLLVEHEEGVDLAVLNAAGRAEAWLRKPGPWHERCWLRPVGLNEQSLVVDLRGEGQQLDARSASFDALLLLDRATGNVRVTEIEDRSSENWGWSLGGGAWIRHAAPSGVLTWIDSETLKSTVVWPDPSDSSGLAVAGPAVSLPGNALLQLSSGKRKEIRIVNAQGVSRPDWITPGAVTANPGADRNRVVWTEMRAGEPWVMTISWPPAGQSATPLRRDPSTNLGANPFAVGCGFVAHAGRIPGELAIIRIRDGRLSTLPRSQGLIWEKALGFSCEGLYAMVSGSFQGVVRVPLAALRAGSS